MMRVRIGDQIFAKSRREGLWEEVARLSEDLRKTAESEKEDIRKVEGVKETYLELRQKLRELGAW